MGQVLHGSARTTAAVRRAIHHSQESLRALARRHGLNPKTVAKWKKRPSVQDKRTGPKEPRSTVLSTEEEAIMVAFRRHTLLLLDDCLYALQATIPHLTRSSLHRCLQRHGISGLPEQRHPPHHARQHGFSSAAHQGGDRARRTVPGPRFRARLRAERYGSSPDQAQAPVDAWSS